MVLQQRHSKNEFSAGGIVYKIVNNVPVWLIVQHSKHKGWIFPKGLIGDRVEGEGKEETALREVEEEGGINAKIVLDKPFFTNYVYTFEGQKIFKTVYFYLMEYVSGEIENHDWEVVEAKWLGTDDTMEQLTYKADKEMFGMAVIAYEKVLSSKY